MQVLKLDDSMITLQKFIHPTQGLSRIIGDYDENPSAPRDSVKIPHYKCEQIEGSKSFFMATKADVKAYIAKYSKLGKS